MLVIENENIRSELTRAWHESQPDSDEAHEEGGFILGADSEMAARITNSTSRSRLCQGIVEWSNDSGDVSYTSQQRLSLYSGAESDRRGGGSGRF